MPQCSWTQYSLEMTKTFQITTEFIWCQLKLDLMVIQIPFSFWSETLENDMLHKGRGNLAAQFDTQYYCEATKTRQMTTTTGRLV